jgi:hypothetical protein
MKAPIAPSCALPGNAPECEIGAFIGFHGLKKVSKITRIAAGVSLSGPEWFAWHVTILVSLVVSAEFYYLAVNYPLSPQLLAPVRYSQDG